MTPTAEANALMVKDRRADVPATHPCGRCRQPATYSGRSITGAALYVCTACWEKPWMTFVQFGPFNHPLRRVGDRG